MQNEEEKQKRVLAGIKDSLVDAERDLEAKKKYVRRDRAPPSASFSYLLSDLMCFLRLTLPHFRELAAATTRKTTVTGTLEESRARQTQLREREAQLADRQRDIRQQLGEKRQQAEQSKSGNKMIEALMKEKQAGRLPGIFGRLVRLLTLLDAPQKELMKAARWAAH